MKELIRNKTFIVSIFLLLVIGGVFYWFAYRPAQIRHECSWVKRISGTSTYDLDNEYQRLFPEKTQQKKTIIIEKSSAITKEEAEASQLEYEKCNKNPQSYKHGRYISPLSSFDEEFAKVWGTAPVTSNDLFCDQFLKTERPEIPAHPEQIEYQKANKEQYEFCIREHGLWR